MGDFPAVAAVLIATGGLALSSCSSQDAATSSPDAQLQDAGCGFRGPNPTVPQARRAAQSYADAYPDQVKGLMKVDNAFDYAYQQLIPGAVEWLVEKSCKDPVPENKFASDVRRDQLVVGAMILTMTDWCAAMQMGGPEIRGPIDAEGADLARHSCPQYLTPQ